LERNVKDRSEKVDQTPVAEEKTRQAPAAECKPENEAVKNILTND